MLMPEAPVRQDDGVERRQQEIRAAREGSLAPEPYPRRSQGPSDPALERGARAAHGAHGAAPCCGAQVVLTRGVDFLTPLPPRCGRLVRRLRATRAHGTRALRPIRPQYAPLTFALTVLFCIKRFCEMKTTEWS